MVFCSFMTTDIDKKKASDFIETKGCHATHGFIDSQVNHFL